MGSSPTSSAPVSNMRTESEIKKLQRENARLKKLVYRDELTGLLNRRGFFAVAERIFKAAHRERKLKDKRKLLRIGGLAILFCDLDRFKAINDRYGHEVGDKALRHAARIVSSKVREIDIIARWGGEEIVVCLVGADEEHAVLIAEEIRKSVSSQHFVAKAAVIPLSLSIGVAGLKNEATLDELLEKADEAMYLAKKYGRNRVVAISKPVSWWGGRLEPMIRGFRKEKR